MDVPLITGDRVVLGRSRGKPRLGVLLRTHDGIAGQYTTFSAGGDLYVFPGAARRYLGTVLDPSLFDVTKSARADLNGRLPVTVAVARGRHPRVPGLTVTHRTATSERGYLTAKGRRAFGAALARQWQRDTRADRSGATLFGGVRRIAAPGVTAALVHPHFQQYTLVIKVLNPAGRAAGSGVLALTNIDDPGKYFGFIFYRHGTAKVSVPGGHYSGVAELDRFNGRTVNSYFMFREGVAVTHNRARVVFDSRKATVRPSVRTPRPATLQTETLQWDRTFSNMDISIATEFGLGSTAHVMPVRSVTKGTLHWITSYHLTGAPTAGPAYTYDLMFAANGSIPADQSYTLAPGDVAEIDSRYFSDAQPRLAVFGRGAFLPYLFFSTTDLFTLQTPAVRTEYVSAPADAYWQSTLIAAPNDVDPFQGMAFDTARKYRNGSVQSVDWLGGLLAPGFPSAEDYGCGWCRTAGRLSLGFTPYSDTDPSHFGTFDLQRRHQVAARFALFRNGKVLFDKLNWTGATVRVPKAAANYRAVFKVRRGIAGFATATNAQVIVSFRSSATSGKPAPKGWCGSCSVLPVLRATVPLPTALDDTMPVGRSTVTFTVQHAEGAADPAIDRVTFAVSGNGGRSFIRVPVTALGSHQYQAVITNRPGWASHGIAVRITAADSAGGSLKETVDNAYYVAQG